MKVGVLHVWLTEPAENNKANKQLINRFTKILGSCKIVRGATSSRKVLELPDGALER